jgi:heme A synthase
VVLPRAPQVETLIEFSHRLSSGLALIGVLALVIWAWRAFPLGHRVRKVSVVALFFMLLEALIGAGLVLLQYVADNVSIARAYWVAGHLVNTFLLLGVLALTAWWGSGRPGVKLGGQGGVLVAFGAALLGVLVLGASGGITALGDTLILTEGIAPESNPIVAALRDLRIFHPLIAFAVGALVLVAAWVAWQMRPGHTVRRLAVGLGALYVLQLLLGAVNVVLKAPIAIQLVHLLISDLIWIGLVLLAAAALARSATESAPFDAPQATLAGRGI